MTARILLIKLNSPFVGGGITHMFGYLSRRYKRVAPQLTVAYSRSP